MTPRDTFKASRINQASGYFAQERLFVPIFLEMIKQCILLGNGMLLQVKWGIQHTVAIETGFRIDMRL